MHVLDFEPIWQHPNYQISTIFPAVLALSELHECNGREVVKGIKMMGWLREESKQKDIKNVEFHSPGLVGALGSAVTASHLLN